MKKLLFFLITLTFGVGAEVSAQAYFSHPLYLKNRFALNPAAAGLSGGWEIAGQGGALMQGVDNGPQQAQFTINGAATENTGLGVQVKSFSAGAFQTFIGQFAGSYQAYFADDHFLSFGMATGIVRKTLDFNGVNPFTDATDPLINADFFNRTSFRVEAGLLYQRENLQLSLSLPTLYESDAGSRGNLVAVAAYKLDLGGGDISLTPLAIFNSYAQQPSVFDGAVMAEWRETAWLQVGYRSNRSLTVAAGVRVKELGFGYSYSQPTGEVTDLYSGGHEVLVTVTLGGKQKGAPTRNPESMEAP